jgi:hypothetical protein
VTCGTCVVGIGRLRRAFLVGSWVIGGRTSRDNPCAAPPSLPHVLWKSDLFLEPCWSVPGLSVIFSLVERIGTWSSGLVRTDHARADQPRGCREKKPKAFLSYRSPYGTFFVVGGYPLVSGLTPAAESFSSPGLLEDSAHWTIAELCRNSSTACEVGPCLKG